MSEASRIRIVPSGNNATVRVLMSHEMESGQRKDGNGKVIPAWHIQDVTVLLNGKSVLTAEWGTAVSKNPFWQFTLKGTKAGDKVSIQRKDNHGDSRIDEATVGSI
jgi:sulfur-oxidizing protein SoxZ